VELHPKQLQIDMNSSVAAQLCPPPKCRLLNWRTVVIPQNKRNHCTVAQQHTRKYYITITMKIS